MAVSIHRLCSLSLWLLLLLLFFYLFRSSLLKIIILSFAQFRFEKVHRISGNSSSRSTKNDRRSSQTTTTSCLFFILLHSFGFLFFLFCQALLRDDDDDDDSVTTCARQRMFLLNFSSSFLPFCVPILYFHAYARSGEEYVILFCTRCRFFRTYYIADEFSFVAGWLATARPGEHT